MKVSTTYGTAQVLKQEPHDESVKYWNCEKRVSFFVTALAIVCVIGYISYEFHGSNSKQLNTKNQVSGVFVGGDVAKEHGQHVYDFDLSSMSSRATIEHCQDPDDISYDTQYGEYSYQQDIQAILNGVHNNWDDFEATMMKSTHDQEFIDCFANEINVGSIDCKMSCTEPIYEEEKRVTFCESASLDLLQQEARPNRRSCMFKLLASSFSDICDASHSHSDRISSAAFKWYKAKYGASKSWKVSDCP
eukprot:CAMPEP_0197035702 /NCGR_PEP_ID=MMETSP1384-20130603/13424_1 /TAXON_ID=29189 /ORGANISM="Ammonia sp." /LENGTH=246 /DNA_ID=CAMNT_0042465795 /DNA_START=77 /DNA_END=817 /DNA_ORIENTATION=-